MCSTQLHKATALASCLLRPVSSQWAWHRMVGYELCSATSNQLEPLKPAVCTCRAIDQFVSDFKAKGLPLYCENSLCFCTPGAVQKPVRHAAYIQTD
jgi:hypothetical protein